MKEVAEVFGVTTEDMRSGRRQHDIVAAIIIYVGIRYRDIIGEKNCPSVIAKEICRHRTSIYYYISQQENCMRDHVEQIIELQKRLHIKILNHGFKHRTRRG